MIGAVAAQLFPGFLRDAQENYAAWNFLAKRLIRRGLLTKRDVLKCRIRAIAETDQTFVMGDKSCE